MPTESCIIVEMISNSVAKLNTYTCVCVRMVFIVDLYCYCSCSIRSINITRLKILIDIIEAILQFRERKKDHVE